MVEIPSNNQEFVMETRDAWPAHLLTKIKSFSLLSDDGIENYESPEFEAGDYKWRLVIHPNGPMKSANNGANHISVYLTIVETSSLPVGWEVNANFSIFLYNQVLDNYLCFQGKTRRFHALKSKWGFSKLISMKSFRDPGNGFLVDGNCVIGAEVAVIETQPVSQCVSVREFGNVYKREWKILDFSKLHEEWNSEEFTVADQKWKIKLYPNGDAREKGRSVSMYLRLVGANSRGRVKADYQLCMKNQLYNQHQSGHGSQWFTSSAQGRGWSSFIPLSYMRDSNKGFVVEDCCIVEVEMSVEAVLYIS